MSLNPNVRVCTHITVNGVPLRLTRPARRSLLLFPSAHDPRRAYSLQIAPAPHRPDRKRRWHPSLNHGDHQRPGPQHHRLPPRPADPARPPHRREKFPTRPFRYLQERYDPRSPQLSCRSPASQKPASAALAQALARSRASRAPSQSASRGHGHPSSPPNPSPLVPSPPRASSPRPRPATSRATAQDEKMRLHSSQ